MKKFLKKLKNNQGSVEVAMFVFGVAVFATIVVFAMDILGLTWQRYLATRELSNMSRLYAIRASDLYFNSNSSTVIRPSGSAFGAEMGDMLEVLVRDGHLQKATLEIVDEGGGALLTIVAEKGTESNITHGASFDRFKKLKYSETLYAKLKIEYRDSGITAVAHAAGENREYTLVNKFAFERNASDNDTIG